jgi:cell wall-associated NlpC family hydrolase
VPSAPPSAGARDTSTPAEVGSPRPPVNSAIESAEGLLGTPYRNGGADTRGFDCSGFVQYVFAQAGIALPRSVQDQWQSGAPIERDEVRRGDLVFFAIGGRAVSHVGIAIDDASFVHAPSTGGVVRIERLAADYWASRYAGARRVGAE